MNADERFELGRKSILMFFTNYTDHGHKAGESVQSTWRTCFAGSKYFGPPPQLEFRPPFGFYRDPYVIGATQALMQLFRDYIAKGSSWSFANKGRYVVAVASVLDPSGDQRLMETLQNDLAGISLSSEYRIGLNDGTRLFAAMFGLVKENDADPVIVAAREMAPHSARFNAQIGSKELDANQSLALAVMILTMAKQIKEKFIFRTE